MHSFFLVPCFSGTGLSTVCLGLVHALDRLGVRVSYFKPITQNITAQVDASWKTVNLPPSKISQLNLATAQKWVAEDKMDQLMEFILDDWQTLQASSDLVIIEGLVPQLDEEYIDAINQKIAQTLGSDIILVAAKQQYTSAQLNQKMAITASLFGGLHNPKLIGCIINKIGAPSTLPHTLQDKEYGEINVQNETKKLQQELAVLKSNSFRCFGFIPWNPTFVSPRFSDIADHLNATTLNEGQKRERRVNNLVFIARTAPNIIDLLKPGALLITPGDRDDILLTAALAELNGVPLAGIIFTGGLTPNPKVLEFCSTAFTKGMPAAYVTTDTLATAQWINTFSTEIPADDTSRLESVMQGIAQSIDAQKLAEQSKLPQEMRLSPPAFKHQILLRAQQQSMRIVLPEGEEPRTVQAAVICAEKNIAHCILLGKPEAIHRVADTLAITLPAEVEIIDPDAVRQRYVAPMVVLRGHKGLTAETASAQLEDNVVLGTMMLAENHVNGLVSGAIHTTANTIRPALQLIKTKDDVALVSSVFFMLLPEQALVYGDCAVNPDPTAEELADIAIQAGETAKAFGIEPKIAMISYSTGASGSGADVEKVRAATALAQQKRPDLLIDGPLQYDAAAIASVALTKAPNSKVAGQTNVFIFPDLNTGNTTYKAVQRSAHVVSVGPVLQGLRKPVNDLSRGATVEDIVYTIAITAIQGMAT